MENQRPIGVFDSGVGGLTVLKEIMEQFPGESILYFGDTARMPYGPKSSEEIIKMSLECLEFLVEKGAKLLVIACNTVSSHLEALQAKLPVPVIGVIEAGVRSALAATRGGPIGIIATEGTVNSGAYPAALKALNPKARVYSQAAPLLAPMVEEGKLNHRDTVEAVKSYLEPLLKKDIDTLVLGCTHYPMLQEVIASVAGPDVRLVNPAEETARELSSQLKRLHLEAEGHRPVYKFYVSARPERFAALGERFLGRSLGEITLVRDFESRSD